MQQFEKIKDLKKRVTKFDQAGMYFKIKLIFFKIEKNISINK